jgi:hypothetical protein
MNVAEYIANIIEKQGRTKTWVAEQSGIKYKTFVDKLTFNRFTAEELVVISKVLNIDLNKLKEDF